MIIIYIYNIQIFFYNYSFPVSTIKRIIYYLLIILQHIPKMHVHARICRERREEERKRGREREREREREIIKLLLF